MELKTKKTVVLDIHEAAAAIEEDLGNFLKKAEGLYLPNREKPSMVDGVTYYHLLEKEMVPYKAGENFYDTVLTIDGDIVVHKSQIKRLSHTPSIPVYGYQIIEDIVRHLVNTCQAWRNDKNTELTDLLEKYFRTDTGLNINYAKLYKRALEETTLIRQDLQNYLHEEEDSEWHVYVVSRQGRGISITRHHDYRTAEFLRLQKEGKLDFLESSEGLAAFQQWEVKQVPKEDKQADAEQHRAFLASPEGEQAWGYWLMVEKKDVPEVGNLREIADSQLAFLNSSLGYISFQQWLGQKRRMESLGKI